MCPLRRVATRHTPQRVLSRALHPEGEVPPAVRAAFRPRNEPAVGAEVSAATRARHEEPGDTSRAHERAPLLLSTLSMAR